MTHTGDPVDAFLLVGSLIAVIALVMVGYAVAVLLRDGRGRHR